MTDTRAALRDAEIVVVKVGSNVLTGPDRPVADGVEVVVSQIADAARGGRRIVLVSSGAIATGMELLGLSHRPSSLPHQQATAAIGQGELIHLYARAFSARSLQTGQILLTRGDFENRTRYLNASNTIHALFRAGAVPLINENDTIAVEEIRFGDNDVLSALVAGSLRADALVMLSTVPGLVDGDGTVVPVVEEVTDRVRGLVRKTTSAAGSGGMGTKIEAAEIATRAGAVVVVADGRKPEILPRLLAGQALGTLFPPAERTLGGRRRWIGHAARSRGKIHVDAGAHRALTDAGKSLLPRGIIEVTGSFAAGDVVTVATDGNVFARGLVNYGADEVRKIMGRKTSEIAEVLGEKLYDEVIHRDNLAITG